MHIKNALKEGVPSFSHRSQQFQEIFRSAVEGIKTLLAIPKEYHIVFVASGTEAMERIVENTVKQKSFHFVNGSFSQRWLQTAKELGKNAQKEEVDFGKGFDKIQPIPKDIELLWFTHIATSRSVM